MCREGHLVLHNEALNDSETLMVYGWLACKRAQDGYDLKGIVLPLTPKYDMRWSFAKRHTFASDPEFYISPLDNSTASIPLLLTLKDENTDCPYQLLGHFSKEAFSSDTGWTLSAASAHTAHIVDLHALCSDTMNGYEDPLLLHDEEIWGSNHAELVSGLVDEPSLDGEKVTVVMNPLHPFADAATAEVAASILLYHIEHHFCLGVDDYLMYIEPAQARLLLLSDGIRSLVQQNRLHLVLWDLPLVRPRKRKKDAFGVPTPAGIHFWQPAQYNHALLLFWGKCRYLLYIDIDEFLSAPISMITQMNENARHVVLFEQVQMYCLGCDSDKGPESKMWIDKGPSQWVDKYVAKGGYAKLLTKDHAKIPGVIEKRHIKCLVHTDDTFVMHNHMPFISSDDESTPIFTIATDKIFLAHFLNLWRFRSNRRFQNDNHTMFEANFNFCGL